MGDKREKEISKRLQVQKERKERHCKGRMEIEIDRGRKDESVRQK